MVATYSDIQGGWPGRGNIDAAALFVGAGDYHLQSGSPAIDVMPAGMAPATDIEGTCAPIPRAGSPTSALTSWASRRSTSPS
jgi:hypothetical protein